MKRREYRGYQNVTAATGFTLVELVAVIAIIAVLLAILTPGLGRMREAGRRTQCLSVTRHLAITAIDHTSHHPRGRFPDSYAMKPIGDLDNRNRHNWELQHNGSEYVPGYLWAGQASATVEQCPSFAGRPDGYSGSSELVSYTGINYNTSYVGSGYGEAARMTAQLSAVGSPAECALFGAAARVSGFGHDGQRFMRGPELPLQIPGFGPIAVGVQHYRHLDTTNVVFVDGHGASHRERYTGDAGHLLPDDAGYLSEDDRLYDLE